MKWSDVLTLYQVGEQPLFDDAFMAQWGDEPWKPTDDDRRAAAKLHVQITSRIASQQLGYIEGVERAALESIYSLFPKAREIADAHPDSRIFDAVTWHVLNHHVRPFTAKWHPRSVGGALMALDATDDFRADLSDLQPTMQRFDSLLVHIRDGVPAPGPVEGGPSARGAVADEMDQELLWGIRPAFSGFRDRAQVDAVNQKEAEAIRRRRAYYNFEPRGHAAGLAMSGGGIRSATFSLGVLVSLARRGLLPQFDYLSTVSGGGYLGSFLSVFLESRAPNVGLQHDALPFQRDEGEASALRHIRHHCKYLTTASMWERLKLLGAQFHGMALNALAIVWLLTMVAAVEVNLRTFSSLKSAPVPGWVLWLLVAGSVTSLIALRARLVRMADGVVAFVAALIGLALGWGILYQLHEWYGSPSPDSFWSPRNKRLWVLLVCAGPLLLQTLAAVFPRALRRLGVVLTGLTAVAVPFAMMAVYLVVYDAWPWLAIEQHLFGLDLPRWLLIALAGGVLYAWAFNINLTSPQRHYQRKLAEAFLIQTSSHQEDGFARNVSMKLTDAGKAGRTPYHLINCTLNVPASRDIAMQGRLSDFFLFSPAFSGSPLIGYWPTSAWEKLNPGLDVATAMAISGAAAAPQMGIATVARLRFWMALLNIRLGHWARRPGVRPRFPGPPGILHLLKEMYGTMNETGPWIHLSDGGHIENLGIYELLRRRCKYIVAIDGEQDTNMTFRGLTTLQRLAAIDLGVQIDIDLNDLRLMENGLSRSHFSLSRIRYPRGQRGSADEFGYLLYVKLSLTGNEGEFLRRYRLDEPAFPHHSTADQFFSEAQFEAYRSLGEHIGNKLFLRPLVGDLGDSTDVELATWFKRLGEGLLEPVPGRRP